MKLYRFHHVSGATVELTPSEAAARLAAIGADPAHLAKLDAGLLDQVACQGGHLTRATDNLDTATKVATLWQSCCVLLTRATDHLDKATPARVTAKS